jgi:hypothetical protein
MRTTCPKCKKGSLMCVNESSHTETLTITSTVSVQSWGYFDADGNYEEQDRETTDETEDDRETEVGDEEITAAYVQCEGCKFVVADHPLSEITEGDLDRILKQSRRRPRRVKHRGAKVATFAGAQAQVSRK